MRERRKTLFYSNPKVIDPIDDPISL